LGATGAKTDRKRGNHIKYWAGNYQLLAFLRGQRYFPFSTFGLLQANLPWMLLRITMYTSTFATLFGSLPLAYEDSAKVKLV
jgi:hypothetical protein